MQSIDVVVESDIERSFRVEKVAGMFDLNVAEKTSERFVVELPNIDDMWSVGAIVGPSGSGKSTIANHCFGDRIKQHRWKTGAVIDSFPKHLTADEISFALTAVGFSSPPSWLKPYRVLSNGEQFRCDLARSLLTNDDLIVVDEFTSVVDRTVAKIGSYAVSKAIRRAGKQLIAVSCHYDILDWLEADWVLDMSDATLTRRRLRRPEIQLELHRCHRSLWRTFGKHHYLSQTLNRAAHCYLAVWKGTPVGFCGVMSMQGRKGRWRVSRLVVLPDYQGVGIAGAMLNAVAKTYKERGDRINLTTSHPAMIRALKSKENWRCIAVRPNGYRGSRCGAGGSRGRSVVSFEFVT